MRPLRAKRAENFQGLEINFGKLLLVYFMKPPDHKVLSVMRPLGASGPGAIWLLPPLCGSTPWRIKHPELISRKVTMQYSSIQEFLKTAFTPKNDDFMKIATPSAGQHPTATLICSVLNQGCPTFLLGGPHSDSGYRRRATYQWRISGVAS